MTTTQSWASRLWPAATYQLCFVASVSMLKPAANALTLSRYQTSALPWLYLTAAAITGGVAAYTALVPRRRLGPSSLAALGAALALALAAGVVFKLSVVALLAYLFAEAFATQVSLTFWGTVGDAFDARESRRAFTWINGLGMSGAIVGGLLAQLAARTLGAVTLLVGAAALLGLAALVFRFHRSALEPKQPSRTRAPQASWREILAQPYVRLLGALVLCFSLVSVLTDFAFRERAAAYTEDEMADFFAANQLWTGVFCVVFQLLLAEQLLRRLGILRYVGLVPAALGAGALAAIAWPTGWAAWALKVVESAASWSLLPVAYQLLYAPLTDDTRDRARRFIDGFWRKGGLGVAGVFLLGLAPHLGATGVLVVVGLLSLAVGFLLVQIRTGYLEAVTHRVAGAEASHVQHDEERLLAEALKSPHPERALKAATLLEHAGLVNAAHVRDLLGHPHERVQEKGVQQALALDLASVAKPLEQLVQRGARRPRDAATWALARLAPERARVVLPPLVASADVGQRCAAIGGLLSLAQAPDAARAALAAQLERMPTASAGERREVVRLLGRLDAAPVLAKALVVALEDADGSVRRMAIAAVGEAGHGSLAPRLLRFLSWRDERRVARAALAKLGDDVVPLLAASLDDRSRALSLRQQLPRVLRDVGTQAAADALLASAAFDEPALRHLVGAALARLHVHAPQLSVDRARVTALLAAAVEQHRALAPSLADARAALGPAAMLTRVLDSRVRQGVEVAFWLLGLLSDARTVRRCHALATGADPRRRAWALELLENLLPDDERAVVAQLTADVDGDAGRLDARLAELRTADDPLLRSCAQVTHRRRTAGDSKEDDVAEPAVRKLLALEGVEIFAEADVDDLAAVAAVAKEQVFQPKERVYAEGDPGDALYVIVDGEVQAERDGEVVLTLKAKESFGETSLFDGAPRVNDVVATKRTTALVIDRRDFLDLLGDRPELLTGMFRVVSRQLKNMVVEVTEARRVSLSEFRIVGGPPVDGEK